MDVKPLQAAGVFVFRKSRDKDGSSGGPDGCSAAAVKGGGRGDVGDAAVKGGARDAAVGEEVISTKK